MLEINSTHNFTIEISFWWPLTREWIPPPCEVMSKIGVRVGVGAPLSRHPDHLFPSRVLHPRWGASKIYFEGKIVRRIHSGIRNTFKQLISGKIQRFYIDSTSQNFVDALYVRDMKKFSYFRKNGDFFCPKIYHNTKNHLLGPPRISQCRFSEKSSCI